MARALRRVRGVGLALRLVTTDDADYIYKLRTDRNYNAHLSAVKETVEDQRRWIEAYQAREAEGREYYYVIERQDGRPCGVFRLYDIDPRTGSFTWGSFILDRNKPILASLECLYLVHAIGFDHLGLERAFYDILHANKTGLHLYRSFAEEIGADENKVYFVYTRERFETDRPIHFSTLRWEADDVGA